MIATHLGGAGDNINLVPMTRDLNRKDYRAIEVELDEALNAGNAVSIRIDVGYPNSTTTTPNAIFVTAWVDGKEQVYEFAQ